MAVRGRNLGSGATATTRVFGIPGNGTEGGDGTAGLGAAQWVAMAVRTSIVLKELGVTVMSGSNPPYTTADPAELRIYRSSTAGPPILLASVAIPASTVVGTEWTSRDGTLQWTAAAKNESDRVFPKGTTIAVEFNNGGGGAGNTGNAADSFAVSCYAPEFGAPPA